MVTLKRSTRVANRPLTWWPLLDAGKLSATVRCANGHAAILTDHSISPDGAVSPSLECPYEGCGWHDNARLDGWVG